MYTDAEGMIRSKCVDNPAAISPKMIPKNEAAIDTAIYIHGRTLCSSAFSISYLLYIPFSCIDY